MYNYVNNLQKIFLELSKYYLYICNMENTKYQYITLKVETKEENIEAKKLLMSGWIPLNFINNGTIIQFVKISE